MFAACPCVTQLWRTLQESQRLIFEGVQLEDDRTLADYNVAGRACVERMLIRAGVGVCGLH